MQEVAELTGVGRERLRTWERRHGFPEPRRLPNNLRTYGTADLPRIAAVARLIEIGYPVGEAIAEVVAGSFGGDEAVRKISLESSPLPALAIGDPADPRITWVNASTFVHEEALRAGDGLAQLHQRLGRSATETICALLQAQPAEPQLLVHGDWISTFPAPRTSLAWRGDTESGPVLLLLQLPTVAPLQADEASHTDASVVRWTAAIAEARRTLQQERGVVSAQSALRRLQGPIGAFDGLLVMRRGTAFRTATSVRGTVSARAIEETDAHGLRQVIAGGSAGWLDPDELRWAGLPSYLQLLAVPMSISGRNVGAIVLAFPQRCALPEEVLELLSGLVSAIAATIERERSLGASTRDGDPARVAA